MVKPAEVRSAEHPLVMLVVRVESVELLQGSALHRPVNHESIGWMSDVLALAVASGTSPARLRHCEAGPVKAPVRVFMHCCDILQNIMVNFRRRHRF